MGGRAGPLAGGAAGPLVLVVDDDDAVRSLIASALADAGYVTQTARDGGDALRLLARLGPRRTPDLILLDLEMPAVDGRAFAARYRARRQPQAPIVVISASPDAAEIASHLGAVDTITKPFDLDQLIERVRRWAVPRVARASRARARSSRVA